MTLHPRGATLVSEGVLEVADINPVNSRLSSVIAGQSGGSGKGQGSKCDGEKGVHLSYSSDSLVMKDTGN